MRSADKEYAVYQGDKFWMIGTREEIMEKTGISYAYFMRAKAPVQFKKSETYKNNNNTILIIEVEDEEGDE